MISRVVNLQELNSEINSESLGNKIIESFFKHYGSTCPIEFINEDMKVKEVQDTFNELSSYSWKFGRKTPDFKNHFETRFSWGILDIHVDSKDGKIAQVVIYSDCLFNGLVKELEKNLTGEDYTFEGVDRAIQACKTNLPDLSQQLDETGKWIKESL